MALRTEQKLPIILSIVFLTLAIVGIVFYRATASLQAAIETGRKTNEIIAITDEIIALSLDAESGVRGFMFTGVDTYLEPLSAAKIRVPTGLAKLKTSAASDPQLTEPIEKADAAARDFLSALDEKVEYRKIRGYEESIAEIYRPDDRIRIERLRNSLNTIKATANDIQAARDRDLGLGFSLTIWIFILSAAVGTVGLVLANLVVYREIRRRTEAETALLDANRGLEAKIEARTAELKEMNNRLLEIGSEREMLLKKEKKSREEAEIANRLRDEFMATVSHELRTPLNSILGWARLLREGSLNHSQAERALATIIKSAETQNRLIEDLLDVARIISGKLELKFETLDVESLIAHSVEAALPTASARHISIEIADYRTETGRLLVKGDRARLDQVISNLLNNAIKFSFEGGKIVAGFGVEDNCAFISVRDFGAGISADFLPLVFERFRQDTSGRLRNGGLGLGLAIVRNLVELHGGNVTAASEGENKGSEFIVRIPLHRDQEDD
jgi:signal transduction histidine kinase